ncbi:hypothetical protein BUZ08_13160 [Staphylococcus gallinarum]|uniref:hypothetical protein n=1 Tax=Staphylococcus gallinarum TaxID=1293 RepID=UPI000D1F3745|nr:hypothetical protein [Staphylococcus gallinarum]PTL14463.1 hypothetical protein BUZ08_13160 [Staphylococcus gallinarum]RIO78820.1 hypothetical protein BUZ07_09250 [Staphylococcus gallinarum]
MKQISILLLSSFLILAACGNKEESKSEDKKETKLADENKKKESKKQDRKKSDNDKKKDTDSDKQQVANNTDGQQNNTQEDLQAQQSQPTNTSNQIPTSKEPTKEEIAEWDRQNIKGGTDYGLIDPKEANAEMQKNEDKANAQAEREQKLQDEYFELSDKMFGDKEYSDEEMNAMEKRQDEILDEVEPIN